ncbi:hypothetical protein ACGF07_16940 [Kitasatospora sp. NPDC048194]|uniref:hypothetical protein n=1 Tax=Kitasatospora sp. NPDC048194 TaxID=3364045 RepID=UPI0037236CE6
MAGGSTGASDGRSSGFFLKPWELHGEGREFERIGGELGKAVGALEKGLAELGTPWGTDQPGSAFAAVYGPARGELLGGLKALAGGVGGVGAGLHAMAGRTTDTDTVTADGFAGTSRPAGGPAGGRPTGPAVASAARPVADPATPGAAPVVPRGTAV